MTLLQFLIGWTSGCWTVFVVSWIQIWLRNRKKQNPGVRTMEAGAGTDWHATTSDGGRYYGSGTVWHRLADGARADTRTESILSERWSWERYMAAQSGRPTR